MWSFACVLGEMATLRPLMAGEDTGDQIGEVYGRWWPGRTPGIRLERYMAADGRGGHWGPDWRGIRMVADGRVVDFCKYTCLFTVFSHAQRCPGLQWVERCAGHRWIEFSAKRSYKYLTCSTYNNTVFHYTVGLITMRNKFRQQYL